MTEESSSSTGAGLRPEFFLTFLWSAVLGFVVYHVIWKLILFRKMPPGPWAVPVLGIMLRFKKADDPFQEYRKMKEKYGEIYSFSCGNYYVIVINGVKNIQDVSKREEFSGRPEFHGWELRNFGNRNRGVLFCDIGPTWQEQRRFTLRSLRDFGLGKASMEGMIIYEMEQLVKVLRKDAGKPMNLSGSFNASVLNSLWTLITGKRFDLDDPKFKEVMALIMSNFKDLSLTQPGLFLPQLGKYGITRHAKQRWEDGQQMRIKMKELIGEYIDAHVGDAAGNSSGDFIEAYLQEMNVSSEGSSFHGIEGDLNLRVVLLDLFIAGVETTSTALLWAALFLSQYPDVQRKVQEETDAVLGDRPAQKEDKAKMVYVEAFICEVLRLGSILPMSVYHKVMKDTEFGGYSFPKGAVLFLNFHDVNHDRKVWEDPEVCRPERFLDPSGTKIVKRGELMPFGVGHRLCLGEPLARDSLFIFLTGLLQNFNFEVDPSVKNYEMKGTPNFISAPQPFNVILKDRGK